MEPVGSTKINLRSIQELVQESEQSGTDQTETTENVELYSDPVETVQQNNTNMSGGGGSSAPPPSSPPPSPPPSGGGGYGGGY